MSEIKKYEFTGETKLFLGKTLHRIRALIRIEKYNVSPGDEGGWIEKEENLDHSGNAWVYGDARVSGNAWVYGNARVSGNAWVYGNAQVYGDAHWLCIGPIGSRNGFTTFFRSTEKKIKVSCGCFAGDIDQFAAKVKLTHGDSDHAKVYMAAIELAKLRIDLSGEDAE